MQITGYVANLIQGTFKIQLLYHIFTHFFFQRHQLNSRKLEKLCKKNYLDNSYRLFFIAIKLNSVKFMNQFFNEQKITTMFLN